MSEEIERAKLAIRLGERNYPDGTIDRWIDLLTDDDLLKLLVVLVIGIAVGVFISSLLSK